MCGKWILALAVFFVLLPALVMAEEDYTDVADRADAAEAASDSDARLLFDSMRKSWGFPGKEIIDVSSRIWLSKGRSEMSVYKHVPIGRTEEKWRFDAQEFKLVIIDGEMRVPQARWLRIRGEMGVGEVDKEHGDFTGNDNDRVANTVNRYAGTAKMTALDRYQINLGIRILGEDAFWTEKPFRSSLTF